MKKLLELSIVVGVLFFIIYFLLYMFYFDDMCNNFKKPYTGDDMQTISQIQTCKSSLVCDISNTETNKQNIIINWECDKKVNKSLELETYINYISELYFNFIDKFKSND